MDPLVIVMLLASLLALDLAAWRWGADSTDGLASPEWERRRTWRGFGAPDPKE